MKVNISKSAQTQQTESQQAFPAQYASNTHLPSIDEQLRLAEQAIQQYQQKLKQKNQQLAINQQAAKPLLNTRNEQINQYIAQWDKIVQMEGNLHFPEEIRSQNLHGKLVLLVTLDANGKLLHQQLLESSGHQLIDQAAMQITQQASPFPKVPSKLLNQKKQFEFPRVWTFHQKNQIIGPGNTVYPD